MKKITILSLSLLSCILNTAPVVAAAKSTSDVDHVGLIDKLDGTVLHRKDNTTKPTRISDKKTQLQVGNQIQTKSRSRAFVKWIDGSKIVLKEKSRLSINDIDYINVDEGRVIFDIAKLKRPKPVRVGVKLSILGIRGTQFVVDSTDDEFNVYLKEGKVTINSIGEDFKIYKEQIESQMRQFKQELESGAKKYKEDLEKRFEQFKKEIELGQAQLINEFELVESAGISVKNNELSLIPIPDEIVKEFELLDKF